MRGNMSVMLFHDYYSNTILNNPFKNHTTQELVRAQMRLIQYLLDRVLKPSSLRIEKEFPKALQSFFRENSVHFQLCQPKKHRTNQAEKAIDTCKCHFLSGLSGVDPNVFMHM